MYGNPQREINVCIVLIVEVVEHGLCNTLFWFFLGVATVIMGKNGIL